MIQYDLHYLAKYGEGFVDFGSVLSVSRTLYQFILNVISTLTIFSIQNVSLILVYFTTIDLKWLLLFSSVIVSFHHYSL